MTFHEFRQLFSLKLSSLYSTREIRSLLHRYVEAKLNIPIHHFYLNPFETFFFTQEIIDNLHRLENGEPIQYVLGYTDFCGLQMNVSPDVLIPRPETEELVAEILRLCALHSKEKKGNILDLGTGSGAIAIALATHLPDYHLTAIDFSENVIEIAKQNAEKHNVKIDFQVWDMLTMPLPPHWKNKFDVIVSNPPYIPYREKKIMHDNVRKFEPATALFVPDDNPLLFYRRIADIGREVLATSGKIAFEIHEHFHEELQVLLQKIDYHNITIIKDVYNKPRMIFCEKK